MNNEKKGPPALSLGEGRIMKILEKKAPPQLSVEGRTKSCVLKERTKFCHNKNLLQLPRTIRRACTPQEWQLLLFFVNKCLSAKMAFVEIVKIILALGICFIAQATLGLRANVNREQINRHIADMAKAGLLYKKYRPRRTCLYAIPRFFLKKEVREFLCLDAYYAIFQRTAHKHINSLSYVGILQEKWGRIQKSERPFYLVEHPPTDFIENPPIIESNSHIWDAIWPDLVSYCAPVASLGLA